MLYRRDLAWWFAKSLKHQPISQSWTTATILWPFNSHHPSLMANESYEGIISRLQSISKDHLLRIREEMLEAPMVHPTMESQAVILSASFTRLLTNYSHPFTMFFTILNLDSPAYSSAYWIPLGQLGAHTSWMAWLNTTRRATRGLLPKDSVWCSTWTSCHRLSGCLRSDLAEASSLECGRTVGSDDGLVDVG